MKQERLFRVMGDIEPQLIQTHDPAQTETSIAGRKHRPLRAALVAAAVCALLVTAVVAAAAHFDALRVYFRGDVSLAEEYLDRTARTVQDDNYIFTVENAIADERGAYLVVTIQALNDETKAFLLSDDFNSIDTFGFQRLDAAEDEDIHPTMHVGYGERTRTENSITYSISLSYGVPIEKLWVRLGYMEEGLGVEVPLTPAPSVTLEPDITGVGIPQDDDTHTPSPFTVDRVILSPLSCAVETSHHAVTLGYMTVPRLLFRMADGQVLTQAQLLKGNGGSLVAFEDKDTGDAPDAPNYGSYIFYYRFTQVQDLTNIKSLILFDMEYPLDGSEPFPAKVPDSLTPFELPAVDRVAQGLGAQVPARALTLALGGTYREDLETGEVECTYRNTTVLLYPGSTDVTICDQTGQDLLPHGHTVSDLEGRLEKYQEPSEWIEGDLAVRADLLFDAWGLDSVCYIARDSAGKAIANTHWLIIP